MAEEKHHHYLFHHKKEEEDKPIESVYTETTTGYAETGFSSVGPGGYGESTIEGYGATTISTESEVDYRKEEKHHMHLEHLGEMGAVATGDYALFSSSFIHSTDNDKTWDCVICRKPFVSKNALGGHMKQHPERQWRGLYPRPTGHHAPEACVCVVCGKRFVSKKALGGHMKQHPERSWRGLLPPTGEPAAASNGNTTAPLLIDLNQPAPMLIDLNQPAAMLIDLNQPAPKE